MMKGSEIIFVFTVVCLVRDATSTCVEDVQTEEAYTNCNNNYAIYINNAAESADMTNPSAMAGILCTAEAKSAAACLLEYLQKCPALASSGDPMGLFSGLAPIQSMGGFDAYCSMAGAVTGPCQAVTQCLGGKGFDLPEESSPTVFSIIQPSSIALCGSFKEMVGCFKDVGDKCKSLEDTVAQAMTQSRSTAPDGATSPTYEEAKMFVMKECQKLPADFGTSSCVKNGLRTKEFINCYNNITVNYPVENNKITCDAYRAGHQCIDNAVGMKCGKPYTEAFAKLSKLFIAGIPSGCELTSGAEFVGTTATLTVFTSILFALILTYF